ncbi:MAG: hypothetical protein COA78_37040 [Blastopirellula sp.]|nr:MAG: hypothetical protein COA78_37040 [Blastopirellula sp.]
MRIDNWPQALTAYLVSINGHTYKLGTHDCCTLVSGCVKAITGVDPMIEFRGKYDSEETYHEALMLIGAGTLYNTLIKKFGEPVVGPQASRGDIAFYEGCCGIITGRKAIFLFEEGYGEVNITKIKRAFRVI